VKFDPENDINVKLQGLGKCIPVYGVNNTRRVRRYQMGNHNRYIEEEQTTQ
jgi:hypothetical protein